METNHEHGHENEVTLVFHPAAGGQAVSERVPVTKTLREVVLDVLRRLNAQNAQNPTVQRRSGGPVLDLNATIKALDLKNGEQLTLAWTTAGGQA
jgi:hypothetical protein